MTAPGMFSHAAVDAGSAFLARYLPKDAKGEALTYTPNTSDGTYTLSGKNSKGAAVTSPGSKANAGEQ